MEENKEPTPAEDEDVEAHRLNERSNERTNEYVERSNEERGFVE